MFLGHFDKFEDEVPDCNLRNASIIFLQILIDPYLPSIVDTDCHHLFCGDEQSEDIDQYFVTYEQFLQEIDGLGERQHSDL